MVLEKSYKHVAITVVCLFTVTTDVFLVILQSDWGGTKKGLVTNGERTNVWKDSVCLDGDEYVTINVVVLTLLMPFFEYCEALI